MCSEKISAQIHTNIQAHTHRQTDRQTDRGMHALWHTGIPGSIRRRPITVTLCNPNPLATQSLSLFDTWFIHDSGHYGNIL